MKIITLTLSPALDVEFRLGGEIDPAGLNRTRSQSLSAGGKGINVSRAIAKEAARDGCSADFLATVAPIGGVSGEMIETMLASEGIKLTAIRIDGQTRINASVIPEFSKAAEFNAPGTPIGDKLAEIEKTILSLIDKGDTLIIAGSCPSDVDKAYPASLIGKAHTAGAYAALDCDGETLVKAVTASPDSRPDLIKPNTDELASLTGMPTGTPDEVAAAAASLGLPTVITTMAGDGAVLTENGHSSVFPIEKRPVVRLKGAGDTFLGAFIYWHRYKNLPAPEAMAKANEVAGKYVAGE